MRRGVLIASDSKQEIFIPWWHSHYSKHNTLPIAVIDLGLSPKGRAWAERIGTCIDYSGGDSKRILSQITDSEMRGMVLHAEKAHAAWSKKPTACALSPFDQTLWIDLDCEVRCDIRLLFNYLDNPAEFGCARDQPHYESWCQEKGILAAGVIGYDSGVMAFAKNSTVIEAWIETTARWDQPFWGDDRILSHILSENFSVISEIPQIYNANPWSKDPKAKILHWATAHGKAEILRQMFMLL